MNTRTTRSSTRLREQRQTSINTTSSIQDGAPHARTQPSPSSTNKPKSTKRRKLDHNAERPNSSSSKPISKPDGRVKGRRGHLKQMTGMPMDVLYEIFNSLEPIDLLRLSWSNKMLQFIIMGKSARFLWDNAFKALYASPHAPPPCPSDLNFAQYTRLLFDKRCMECSSPHGTHVMWSHRLRVCGSCLEGERFIALTGPYRYWHITPTLRTVIHGKHQTYALAAEYNEAKAKMDSLDSTSTEWTEYTRRIKEWRDKRQMNEWKFAQWQREQKRDRKSELEKTRTARLKAIVAKLSELGWKEELDRLNVNQLWTLPSMRVAKPLTEKAWEALCPEVVEHLEAVRDLRLEQEKRKRVADRCRILSDKVSSWAIMQTQPRSILPKVLDVAFKEPFKSFIFEDSDTEPAFITDKDDLTRVMEQFTEEWNEARNHLLLSLIPGSINEGSRLKDVKGKGKATYTPTLDLATTFFQCSPGQEAISYPRILAHDCQRPPATNSNKRVGDPEGLDLLSTGSYPRPWLDTCQDLTFDREASDAARTIVRQCGEDPDGTTVKRMDEIDPILECVKCSEPKRGRHVMKWRMAISHELDKHSTASDAPPSIPSHEGKNIRQLTGETRWRLVTEPEDLAQINAKEKSAKNGRPYFACKACRGLLQSSPESKLEAMRIHWQICFRRVEELDNLVPDKSQIIPEEILSVLFEEVLDQPVKNNHTVVKIPMRKEGSRDVEMA